MQSKHTATARRQPGSSSLSRFGYVWRDLLSLLRMKPVPVPREHSLQ